MPTLNALSDLAGKWKYQSYRPNPVSLSAQSRTPEFVAWSPPGDVTIDTDGSTGKLAFDDPANRGTPLLVLPLKLTVSDGNPEQISILAAVTLAPGFTFSNELVGWFVPADPSKPIGTDNPGVIRGSIIQTSPSLPPKAGAEPPPPAFTTGFFVLERA